MRPENDMSWPRRHKKELGIAAGGFAMAIYALGVSRGVLPSPVGEIQEKRRHHNAEDIAAMLVDPDRGDDLPGINRMVALMSTIKRGTKAEINELFGADGAEAARYITPFISKRFVQFRSTVQDGVKHREYVVNEELASGVIDVAREDPGRYALFLMELENWQQKLNPEPNDNP